MAELVFHRYFSRNVSVVGEKLYECFKPKMGLIFLVPWGLSPGHLWGFFVSSQSSDSPVWTGSRSGDR